MALVTRPGWQPDTSQGARVLRELPLPFLDLLAQNVRVDTARFVMTQSFATLGALRQSVDRWLLSRWRYWGVA